MLPGSRDSVVEYRVDHPVSFSQRCAVEFFAQFMSIIITVPSESSF